MTTNMRGDKVDPTHIILNDVKDTGGKRMRPLFFQRRAYTHNLEIHRLSDFPGNIELSKQRTNDSYWAKVTIGGRSGLNGILNQPVTLMTPKFRSVRDCINWINTLVYDMFWWPGFSTAYMFPGGADAADFTFGSTGVADDVYLTDILLNGRYIIDALMPWRSDAYLEFVDDAPEGVPIACKLAASAPSWLRACVNSWDMIDGLHRPPVNWFHAADVKRGQHYMRLRCVWLLNAHYMELLTQTTLYAYPLAVVRSLDANKPVEPVVLPPHREFKYSDLV